MNINNIMADFSYGPISGHVDLDSPGKRFGSINLNHSDNRHAFSTLSIPIAIIKGIKKGPTILLTAGNHGDEYEGQCILRRLIQDLDFKSIKGRIIILPALNYPAVRAGTRVSPLDQGNLNRSFPGCPNAGPTKAIAGFVVEHLFPLADFCIDFHSGGSTSTYVNTGFLCKNESPDLHRRNVELVETFGAPFTMVVPASSYGGDIDSAAHRMKLPFISCELGGAGTISPSALKCGWEGLIRVLLKNGIIENDHFFLHDVSDDIPQTCFVDMASSYVMVTANYDGLFSPLHEVGNSVSSGDIAGYIYSIQNSIEPLEQLYFGGEGIIVVKRRDTLVRSGDHLYCVAPILDRYKVISI
jgi:predicted deacylase